MPISNTYYERSDCRYCGSRKLVSYLDLGAQPPSNSFISRDQTARELKYPLNIFICQDCSLSQLRGVVSAKVIFDDYFYISSFSKALVQHYGRLTRSLVDKFSVSSLDGVLDIGCNDGIILDTYPGDFNRRVGVEPSKVGAMAENKGHKIYRTFFDRGTAQKILDKEGPMKIITATNVFAHIDDIHSVAEGVGSLLSSDGVFVIETPYLIDMIEKNLFDTIYHEHLCYIGLTSLSKFLDLHGLEVFDVERVDMGASGPAIRVCIQKKGGPRTMSTRVTQLLEEEKYWGIQSLGTYQAFGKRIMDIKSRLTSLLDKLKTGGARIGAYSAPAKGNTLLNTFGIGSQVITEGVAETNKMKIGMLTPGSHLPIVSEEDFLKRKPDYAILLTWNYLEFFLNHSAYIKQGGKFIAPLPEPGIFPAS